MNEYVKRFINNPEMSSAVYDSMRKSFMRRKQNEDTDMKAARFLALELLQEAWMDMSRAQETGHVGKKIDHV